MYVVFQLYSENQAQGLILHQIMLNPDSLKGLSRVSTSIISPGHNFRLTATSWNLSEVGTTFPMDRKAELNYSAFTEFTEETITCVPKYSWDNLWIHLSVSLESFLQTLLLWQQLLEWTDHPLKAHEHKYALCCSNGQILFGQNNNAENTFVMCFLTWQKWCNGGTNISTMEWWLVSVCFKWSTSQTETEAVIWSYMA